tara:strand:- start:78 stop:1442 length:1365 start_codon:yes stop_codon:yes gene_type:complete
MVSFNQFIIILSRVDELFLALYMLILTFIYFAFPFNKKNLSKISNSSNFNNFDAMSINIVFHLCFFLILSFFKINHFLIGYIIFFLAILMNLHLIKSIKFSLLNSIFFIFLLLYSIKFTSFASLEWDGLSHWFYKTQIFYQEGSLDDFQKVPYPFYPHLGPYVWAHFWKLSHSEYEYMGRFFYIIFFLTSCFCLSNRINNYYLKIIYFIGMIIFFREESLLFGGYQEHLLFSLIAIFSSFYFFLEKEFKSNKIKFSILYILILVILPWIKDEGIIGSFILLFIIFFTKKYIFKEKLLIFLIFCILTYVSYYFELQAKGAIEFQIEKNFDLFFKYYSDMGLILNIIISLIFETVKVFFRYPIWFIFLICAYYMLKSKKKSETNYIKIICITFFVQILILFVGYLFLFVDQLYKEPIWALQTSVFRLILNTSGLYSVILIKFLNDYGERFWITKSN